MAKSEKTLNRSGKLLNRARMLLNRSEYWRKQSDPQGQVAHSLEAIATLLLVLVEREETGERREA